MHANGKADHKENKYDPFIRARFIRLALPFQNFLEYNNSKVRSHGINFTFHRTVPEGIRKSICIRTYNTSTHNTKKLCRSKVFCVIGLHYFFCKMCNAPEKKKYAETACQGTHYIHSLGSS